MENRRSEFRRRRLEAGFSQESLAQRVGSSTASVRAWESGVRLPTPRYRLALAEALGVTPMELARMLDPTGLVQPLDGDGLSPAMAELSMFVRSEQTAVEISSLDLSVVPALVQTRRYAERVERASHRRPSADDVQRFVDLRLSRQLALERPDPPRYNMVVPRWVLDTSYVDVEQLQRLLDLAQRPTVDLRVIDGAHLVGIGASFAIVRPPGAADPSLVVEFGGATVHYEESALRVSDFVELFGNLQDLALPPDKSEVDLTERLHQQQKEQEP